MRVNLPVTQHEIIYPDHYRLITTTDLQGNITFANDDFVQVSGFKREELLGQAHNLIRHPDMPPAAFADMWKTIQSGRSWKGLVKNRCKNGDHYWVDAYVTPIFQAGQLIEYQSVRVQPDSAAKKRAGAYYQALRQEPARRLSQAGAVFSWQRRVLLTVLLAPLLLAGLCFGFGQSLLAGLSLGIGMFSGMLAWGVLRPFRQLSILAQQRTGHPVLTYL